MSTFIFNNNSTLFPIFPVSTLEKSFHFFQHIKDHVRLKFNGFHGIFPRLFLISVLIVVYLPLKVPEVCALLFIETDANVSIKYSIVPSSGRLEKGAISEKGKKTTHYTRKMLSKCLLSAISFSTVYCLLVAFFLRILYRIVRIKDMCWGDLALKHII